MKKRECKVGQIFSVSIGTAGALKLSPAHSRVEDREDHLPQSKDERHKNEKSESRTKRTKRYQKKETTYQTTGAETTDLENDATLEDLFFHREKVGEVSNTRFAFLKKKEISDLSSGLSRRGESSMEKKTRSSLAPSAFK